MSEVRGLAGMGTTIAALTIVGDEVLVVNVGNSRVYHLDANRLVQLTVDDALSRTALTQSLGGEHQLTPVRPHVAVVPADEQRFLLATAAELPDRRHRPQVAAHADRRPDVHPVLPLRISRSSEPARR